MKKYGIVAVVAFAVGAVVGAVTTLGYVLHQAMDEEWEDEDLEDEDDV